MNERRALLLLLVGLTAAAACGDDGSADAAMDAAMDAADADTSVPPPDPSCNPLAADWDCLLPFPSDFFLTGGQVTLPEPAQLHANAGPVDVAALHVHDGFSPGSPLMIRFPVNVDDAPLVFHTDDVTESLGDASPTVLLDADTGERVLHFAEIDPTAPVQKRLLYIRPMVPLAWGHRYVAAIRGLDDVDGNPLPVPEGFRQLRDGETPESAALEGLAARYEDDVFAPLVAAGVARAELILAWDFTVRSEDNTIGDMVGVRNDLVSRMETDPPAVTVTEVTDDYSDTAFRRIEATITVPLYVDSIEVESTLNRDGSGAVVANGTAEVPFTILIPRSVAARDPMTDPPARALMYGHGFFGSREEAVQNTIHEVADDRGFVLFFTDWWGMTQPDGQQLGISLAGEPTQTMKFTDRVHQGMANFMAVAHAIRTTLTTLPELIIGGELVYEPAEVYYWGNSQGHILGGTFVALSPDIDRAVLGVGGANFSLMMFRARPFFPFLAILAAVANDAFERQKVQLLAQLEFDRIDPLSYSSHLVTDPYPGTPAGRRVLMQIGVNDAQVTNLAAHLHARAVGAAHLTPAPRPITGLEDVTAPYDGPATIEEFDFGVAPTDEMLIPEDNEVHEGVRRLAASQEQLDRFLRPDGMVEQTCDGPCDPE